VQLPVERVDAGLHASRLAGAFRWWKDLARRSAPSIMEGACDGRLAPQVQLDALLHGVPFALKTTLRTAPPQGDRAKLPRLKDPSLKASALGVRLAVPPISRSKSRLPSQPMERSRS
jgi:hypothetical protein